MSCEVVVVVREARARDSVSRGALMRDTLSDQNWDTFLHLFFQESTLLVLVLCCATMFIFAGVSLSVCALVPVVVALVLRVAVSVAQHVRTDQLIAELRHEAFGLVAEVRGGAWGPWGPAAGAGRRRVLVVEEAEAGEGREGRVVGTVSVARHRRERGAGWLHALCVQEGWRRAGVGAALVRGARARGEALGLVALESDVTQRQDAARTLLERDRWVSRGEEERAGAGGAFTQAVLRLRSPSPAPAPAPAASSRCAFQQIVTEKRDAGRSYAGELSAGRWLN